MALNPCADFIFVIGMSGLSTKCVDFIDDVFFPAIFKSCCITETMLYDTLNHNFSALLMLTEAIQLLV
jgi:hypothetical protein